MVEQMVSSNLSKYGLGKCPTIMSRPENPPVAVKDKTMKSMQNDNKTKDVESDDKIKNVQDDDKTKNVQDDDKTKNVQDDDKTKNVQNDDKAEPPGPFEAKSPPRGSNVNLNLVYARRKSDSEQLGDKKRSPQNGNDGIQSFAHIPVDPIADRVRNSENEQLGIVNLRAMEHWNARFVQLQKYLKQCEESNQDVYLKELRTFSPDECSRHAVELEKRAIQLVVEEGREIKRVKDLNVLGKSSGNHLLIRQPIPMLQSEKMV